MPRKILVTFVGLRDPYPNNDQHRGPIFSLLLVQTFDELFLLCSSAALIERARDLEDELRTEGIGTKVHAIDMPIADVISYQEIWQRLTFMLDSIDRTTPAKGNNWYFLLDSGTPQMKSCLFLAGRTGRYPVRLLQGIPPKYAQGAYKVRDITDHTPSLPIRQVEEPVPKIRVVQKKLYEPGGIIATNRTMHDAIAKARKVGQYHEPVLILGETGTGKTIIARTIHAASPRRDEPFVELNCAAIPDNLGASMLFGHERGAFTGADRTRAGAFRSSDKGTLFLDEIGDLPLEVQIKLLKAIEEKTFHPVGSDKPVRVDVRIIAATNQDLQAQIREKKFRRDLYERLRVVEIRLPPLRERMEDLDPLVDHTLATWNREYDERKYFSEEARERLRHYVWPGNIRELINAIRSAAATSIGDEVGENSLPDHVLEQLCSKAPSSSMSSKDFSLAVDVSFDGIDLRARLLQIEWEYVSDALRRTHGNREAAARSLGMTGHSFRKALRERFFSFLQQEGWEEY